MNKKSLSRLLGFLLSDGGISNSKIPEIFFVTTDKALATHFVTTVEELFEIKIKRRKRKNKRVTDLRISSKEIVIFINQLVGSTRTKACNHYPICPVLQNKNIGLEHSHIKIGKNVYSVIKLPKFILNNKENAREFLRAMFSCDGGVSLYPRKGNEKLRVEREVFLGCRHPLLRDQIQKILKEVILV